MTPLQNAIRGVPRIPGLRILVLLALAVFLFSGTAVAACNQPDDEARKKCELNEKFDAMGNLIIAGVAAIAVPNGGLGVIQWMTAGDSVERDEAGRRRIRNTVIGLGIVSILRVLVELVTILLGINTF